MYHIFFLVAVNHIDGNWRISFDNHGYKRKFTCGVHRWLASLLFLWDAQSGVHALIHVCVVAHTLLWSVVSHLLFFPSPSHSSVGSHSFFLISSLGRFDLMLFSFIFVPFFLSAVYLSQTCLNLLIYMWYNLFQVMHLYSILISPSRSFPFSPFSD